jgi:hypothetical protein
VLRSRWLVALVVVGLGVPVFGQEAVDLKWKFEKGKKFYQEMTTQTAQEMNVMGQKINQTQKQTFVFSWEPLEFNEKDKTWKIKQKIEQMKMDIQIGGAPITYDSTKEAAGANNPLSDFFKALINSEFILEIDAEGKVKDIKGRDDFIKKLSNTNQTMEPLLKGILTDEALKQMADPAFGMLPDKPKKKGETWDKTSKLNLGPLGSYENTYKYTLEGVDKDVATIKVDATVKYIPPAAGAGGSLPFRIQSADLKSEKTEGKIEFDVKAGRLASSKISQKLKGKLNIDISGMTSDVTLDQDQTTTVKTMNELPKEAPAPAAKPEK